MNILSRRRFLALAGAAPLAAAVGCQSGFSVFGYRAGADALYDPNIKTVYVPIFNNRAFQTTPYRGFEVDLTQAVIREIGRTTSFRHTSNAERADTELLGAVISILKTYYNRNQQNMIREGELQVTVDVVWRDLRTGDILSNPPRAMAPGAPNPLLDLPPVPFDPNAPFCPEEKVRDVALPARLLATGRFIPELGETNASAASLVQTKLAVQIVSMMEKQW